MIGARFDEVTLWDDAAPHLRSARDRSGSVGLLVAPHSMGSGYVVLAEAPGEPGEWLVGQVPVGAFARPRILSYTAAFGDLKAAVGEFQKRTVFAGHPAALIRLIEETRRTAL